MKKGKKGQLGGPTGKQETDSGLARKRSTETSWQRGRGRERRNILNAELALTLRKRGRVKDLALSVGPSALGEHQSGC
jgi:hypothetical protein